MRDSLRVTQPRSRSARRSPVAASVNAVTSVFLATLVLSAVISSATGQDILSGRNNLISAATLAAHHHKFGCGCMEYWGCITRYKKTAGYVTFSFFFPFQS